MSDNKTAAQAAYNEMCEQNMIPKSMADEMVFTAGFMAGRLSALDEQIKRIGEMVK